MTSRHLGPALIYILAAAAAVGLGACGKKSTAAAPSGTGAVDAAVAAEPAAVGPAALAQTGGEAGVAPATGNGGSAAAPAKAKLQIQLRSTPTGADISIDGQSHGKTPVTVAIEDDGREHEFMFVLPGYAMERYRTTPLKSGVIHARMRAVGIDAGD